MRKTERNKEFHDGDGRHRAQNSPSQWHKHAHSRERPGPTHPLRPRLPRALVLLAPPDHSPGLPRLQSRGAGSPRLRRHGRARFAHQLHLSPRGRRPHRPPGRHSPDQDKVFVVGHDWGAFIAWYLCLFRPDRVKALVNMSVAFLPRNPQRKSLESLKAVYGDDYYICRFQEPGVIEAEFAKIDTARVMKEFLTYRNPGPLFLPKDKINWELTAAWTGAQVKVPVKFIVGDQDLTYNSVGTKDFIHKGGFKKYVPLLEEVVVMEGVAHFINQERPDEINKHIHDFFAKFH
ncbi:alpha/beta-Hydrolases superfamily protein [Prunus dulcis]|uniref:Alpha/beta-Hydrolases superfamily protein n=1 Tax=Prunus dulcis TaxID=3755 RepID=A0A4Y1QMR1_PRUDU|nr:alpha/beta-Hydrolases superfamily protein [Prunus dulcis]